MSLLQMVRLLDCRTALVLQRQQSSIALKQHWLAALAIAIAVSACISFAHASSAVPVNFSSHNSHPRQKMHWPERAVSHFQISRDDQTTSLPGSDKIVAARSHRNEWSTAWLSVARYGLAATSLPSQGLALFAGGLGAACL